MIAWALGWIWWTVLPIRKRLAVASYRRCFPERSPGELRRSVGELAVQYLELALGRRAVVVNPELAEGGGLCLAGHFGAWDIMLVSLALKVPVTAFIKVPSSRLAAWVLARLRAQATDLELLTASDSPRRAYDALKAGRLVLLVQDQRLNSGRAVPFFGHPAKTSPGFGAMAWQTGAPLLGVYQWREGGQHYVKLERLVAEIPEKRGEAIAALTAESQRFYEEKIRLRPWSWLWLHDRWR
ncbi:MAG: KDO2-lipid IV(A) lauroyltransferase [Myxococcota bacterium]|jgi:KDO2-lipid IV(A) lauroyltransferase